MTRQRLATLLLSLCTAAGSATVLAEDSAAANPNLKLATGEPVRCLSLNRIDETVVLDANNVLFYTGRNEVYLNDLPHRCLGLSRNKPIMYRTSLNQLCSVDVITVLESMGSSYMPGPSCGLGMFYPISKEDADKLRKESRK